MLAGSASGGITVRADRVVRFADLPRGWVKGIPRDVRPTSRIVGVLGGRRVATGPTRNGNYCMAFSIGKKAGVGGCVVRSTCRFRAGLGEIRPCRISPISRVDAKGAIDAGGSVSATLGTHLYFVYADGAEERVALTFVGRPIRAGFFFRSIPSAHRSLDTRLRWLELRRGDQLVARVRAAVPIPR